MTQVQEQAHRKKDLFPLFLHHKEDLDAIRDYLFFNFVDILGLIQGNLSYEELYLQNVYCPEKLLLLALIERTFLDLNQLDPQVRKEATRWIFSDEKDRPFSFLWILEELKLEQYLGCLRKKAYELIKQCRLTRNKKVVAEKENSSTS